MTTPKPASQPQAAVAAFLPVPARPRTRRKHLSAVNGITRQFGGRSGPIGHLVCELARQRQHQPLAGLRSQAMVPTPASVLELAAPGIALRELAAAFVVGVGRSRY